MNKTYSAKKTDVKKEWYIVDAKEWVLGRLAARVSMVLRGKHKPIFTPHLDTGDNVIIINAEKINFTGKKLQQKVHFRTSGYPGGAKFIRYDELMKTKPEKVIYLAVRGMLPKNRLRDRFMKKLHIYQGEEHPHTAQQAKALELRTIK
ncbi:50S ribosomal protein L13 [bacterium]